MLNMPGQPRTRAGRGGTARSDRRAVAATQLARARTAAAGTRGGARTHDCAGARAGARRPPTPSRRGLRAGRRPRGGTRSSRRHNACQHKGFRRAAAAAGGAHDRGARARSSGKGTRTRRLAGAGGRGRERRGGEGRGETASVTRLRWSRTTQTGSPPSTDWRRRPQAGVGALRASRTSIAATRLTFRPARSFVARFRERAESHAREGSFSTRGGARARRRWSFRSSRGTSALSPAAAAVPLPPPLPARRHAQLERALRRCGARRLRGAAHRSVSVVVPGAPRRVVVGSGRFMADGAPPPPPLLSPAEEQERWLQDAFKAVKQHAFFMRRALVRAAAPRRRRDGVQSRNTNPCAPPLPPGMPRTRTTCARR